MEIKNHLLIGNNVVLKKSPSYGEEFIPGNLDSIVVHYSGGPALASINTVLNPRIRFSMHLIISRDGTVTQLVPFNMIAWHAGQSSHLEKIGMNQYSVSIELENSGVLIKSGNVFRSWFGSVYQASEVIEAVHRNQTESKFWHIYTEEQIQIVTEIFQILVDNYNIKYILGHEEISPLRKIDPGPAFPLDTIRDRILKGDMDQNEMEEMPGFGKVIVGNLNVRMTPDMNADKAARPLPKAKKVTIIGQSNEWYKISFKAEGWVLAKYIELMG